MGALIALFVNVLHALTVAVPAMAKAFVDIRRALKKTVRVARDHTRQALSKGKRKYRTQRNRFERTKSRKK